ncbi:MAG: response regulator [Acidobacteriota bacterium]
MQPLTGPALSPSANIMIVDDNPANLRLLEDMLRQQGHEVHSFPLGRLALAAAARKPPDLILLDVNMPEMNGYEVCERLKTSGDVAKVPVIFLSALTETKDKVMAFRSGAVDYISKPFQFEEVHARVETHLELHNLQRALLRQNESLEQVVAARTRELAQANERLTILDRSKDDFLRLISHEFRTPLNGLMGVAELILAASPATPEQAGLQSLFERCRERLVSLLDDALLFTQIGVTGDQVQFSKAPLNEIVDRAVLMSVEFAESRSVTLASERRDLGVVWGTRELLVRAVHSLIETAVKFSAKGKTVRLTSAISGGHRKLMIDAEGRMIPDAVVTKFFDLFSVTEVILPGGDMGITAPLASRILTLLGASVNVENCEDFGIRMTVRFRDAGMSTP